MLSLAIKNVNGREAVQSFQRVRVARSCRFDPIDISHWNKGHCVSQVSVCGMKRKIKKFGKNTKNRILPPSQTHTFSSRLISAQIELNSSNDSVLRGSIREIIHRVQLLKKTCVRRIAQHFPIVAFAADPYEIPHVRIDTT